MNNDDRWIDFAQAGACTSKRADIEEGGKEQVAAGYQLNGGRVWRTRISWVDEWLKKGDPNG